MSYVAIATNEFDEMVHFYGVTLGLTIEAQWDRSRGRGTRFDLGGGLRLEILDNTREPRPLRLVQRGDDTYLVIEVDDIYATRERLQVATPPPTHVSWGAAIVEMRDPSGIPVIFLQWENAISNSAPASVQQAHL